MLSRQRTLIRGEDDLRRRRQQLYRAATPAFRALGYRQVTLKALARACGLSIPGLYRYFASKRDFALFPLSRDNRPGPSCFAPSGTDPLVHLRIWIEHGARDRADYLLALSLMQQMPEDERPSRDELRECFAYHEELLAGMMTGAAPGLTPARATDAAQAILAASLGLEAIVAERSIDDLRLEFIRIARERLLGAGSAAAHFEDVMSAPPGPHVCPGDCAPG